MTTDLMKAELIAGLTLSLLIASTQIQFAQQKPAARTRRREVPGAMHGPIIGIGMPDVFAFFNKHTKPASR